MSRFCVRLKKPKSLIAEGHNHRGKVPLMRKAALTNSAGSAFAIAVAFMIGVFHL